MAWKVKFFQTARGDYPVKEFLKDQDEATYAKVLLAVRLLANNGPFLKPPYIEKLQNRLYELMSITYFTLLRRKLEKHRPRN